MRKPRTIEEYKTWLGKLGAQARRDALTPRERQEIARKAVRTRWARTTKAERREAARRAARARWAKR